VALEGVARQRHEPGAELRWVRHLEVGPEAEEAAERFIGPAQSELEVKPALFVRPG
jgi:hypothetical protein